eukprot:6920452-Pyramimonas_sp.AAC.1
MHRRYISDALAMRRDSPTPSTRTPSRRPPRISARTSERLQSRLRTACGSGFRAVPSIHVSWNLFVAQARRGQKRLLVPYVAFLMVAP